jgi:hypothetical protein
MDADRFITPLNPLIIGLLHSPLHFLASAGLMTLRYEGRRSGRVMTLPVGYQLHAGGVDVLVSKAQRKQWWRNFESTRDVDLRIRGARQRGVAQLVPSTSPEFGAAFERTFARLPFLPAQFGVDDYVVSQGLSPDQLASLSERAKHIRITLVDGS